MTGIGIVEIHISVRTAAGVSSIPDKAIVKLTDPVIITTPIQVNTAPVAGCWKTSTPVIVGVAGILVVFQRSKNNHVINRPVHIKGTIHCKLRICIELDYRPLGKRQRNIVIYRHMAGKNNRKVGFRGPRLICCNCSVYNKTVDTVSTAGIV